MHRRRVGLRQDPDGARRHGPAAAARATFRRSPRAGGTRSRAHRRAGHGRHPRQPHGHDLPRADDLAQSGLHHRQPARGGAAAPPARFSTGGASARRLSARPRRHHGGGKPSQAISPSALRRLAAARDDRHGADVLAVADPGRRADHGARCDDPGADPASAGRAAARARHGPRAHHPRSRHRRPHRHARRGDVRRPGGGDRPCRRHLRSARASLHPRPVGLHPGARPHTARRAARHYPRHGALADRQDAGLQLCRPLSARHRCLPAIRHPARASRPRSALRALHPPQGDRRDCWTKMVEAAP